MKYALNAIAGLAMIISGCGLKSPETTTPMATQEHNSKELFEVFLSPEEIKAYTLPMNAAPRNHPTFLKTIDQLITRTANKKEKTPFFARLVKATAWTESTWNHYVTLNNRYYVILGDGGHSFGMMQIHDAYHPQTPVLAENIEYGSKYLHELLVRARRENCPNGKNKGKSIIKILRRTYAQYNDGPDAMCRAQDLRDDKIEAIYLNQPWQKVIDSQS